jgi:glycerol uptake facilitator-like aquaporin
MSHESKVFVETWGTSPTNTGRVFAAVFAHSDDLAIFAGGTPLSQVWLFWAAPIAGALVGGFIYKNLLQNNNPE